MGKQIKGFAPAAQQELLAHHWPGNVRELRNVIERAVILEKTEEIKASNLPDFQLETRLRKSPVGPAPPSDRSLDESMADFERELILSVLEETRHSLSKTAEQLKISRHALRYRMQRLNITGDAGVEEDGITPAGKDGVR